MFLPPRFDAKKWSQENFAGCDLKDQRRSRRLEFFAAQAAERSAASIPQMGETWAGTKGIYRLLDRPEATLESVTQVHRERTTRQRGRFVIASDTTHVDFGWYRDLPDTGPIGPGGGQGFLLHSGLLIDAHDGALIGLAGQVAHVRDGKRKGRENASRRFKRWRESEMWMELFEQVGSPPEGAEYIHLCDSAADNFAVFCTAQDLGCDFVVRGARLHRNAIVDGQKMPLSQAISDLDELGRYELEIARGNGRQARTATLRVTSQTIAMPVPRHRSQRVKDYVQSGGGDIPMTVVVVEEIDPPDEVEPIRWVLLTSLQVESFEDAREVVGWYENRWLVEEFHKGLKTGCRLEDRQLQSVERLLPLTGVLSVVAVMLVQLKSVARTRPHQPAAKLVPPLWLKLLKAKGKTKTCDITNREFWRAVAKLGGFLGRRGDGEPGWQLIWRGWKRLYNLAEGATLAAQCG